MLNAYYFWVFLSTFNIMSYRSILLACMMLAVYHIRIKAQVRDSIIILTGIVYDEHYRPVPATHVINLSTYQGDVTDSLGIFRLPVHSSDTLLIRNIAFQDALVPVSKLSDQRHVLIKRKYYALLEARIYEWGSTYGDFCDAFIEMPDQQTLGESMGLPSQDPDYIPYDMNEEVLKSLGFLITSPIAYLYHNFSRHAHSARKVYWLNKNKEKQRVFDDFLGSENISSITSLTGMDLQEFLVFLNEQFVCNYNCTELKIYTEIHGLWEVYQKLHPE